VELDVIHGVHLVSWPRERLLRDRLATAGAARLLLIAPGGAPPGSLAPDEACVATSISYAELVEAASRLAADIERFDHDQPWIDDAGTAHRGDLLVVLSPPEAAVLAELLDCPGRVVSRQRLEHLLELTGHHSARSLEAVVYRLRRRLVTVRVVIRSARLRGFAIDVGRWADGVGR
jgi:hypothetical protein